MSKINIFKRIYRILWIEIAPSCQKLGIFLENKMFRKLKLSKNCTYFQTYRYKCPQAFYYTVLQICNSEFLSFTDKNNCLFTSCWEFVKPYFFFYFRLIIQPTLPTNGLHNWWGDLLFSNRCSPNWCFWESCATFMARRINLIVIFDVFPWAPPAHWNEGKKKGSYQKPVYLHLIYYLMNHQITYAFCYWN